MPTKRSPRKGSMQVWPRKRAKSETVRVRSWAKSKDAKPLGFPGYKAGMTHILITDNRANSITKGEDIRFPVTVIECPPIKLIGFTLYKKDAYGLHASSQILADKLDKELAKKFPLPKKSKKKVSDVKIEEYADLMLLVQTQPKLTGIGKKKPEIFELGIGGDLNAKFDFVKNNLGKELKVEDVLQEGMLLDSHAVTRGKGFQGPVKRFGVAIRQHKSEKTKRGPGSLGPWHGKLNWTVSNAGQMGYHQRVDYNKWLLKIGNKPEEINPKGGFLHYGDVKNNYILVKGSIQGPAKRMIKLIQAVRPDPKVPKEAPAISYVSLEAKQ
ncbi:50S ribosomal protein L3 [Candidatus Woesearchaeota archaeon]|nr:50S ribosomal protein L3 [Candidatus Woesearchaeota archaeon]MBW3006075.1 50S ribosomal protein L3 [Candidatus Woesearchaeota archaeon]